MSKRYPNAPLPIERQFRKALADLMEKTPHKRLGKRESKRYERFVTKWFTAAIMHDKNGMMKRQYWRGYYAGYGKGTRSATEHRGPPQ